MDRTRVTRRSTVEGPAARAFWRLAAFAMHLAAAERLVCAVLEVKAVKLVL